MRATRLARRGADSWTTTSTPTSVSFPATYSAAARSPTVVSWSPVLVVSIRNRSWQRPTTSSAAVSVIRPSYQARVSPIIGPGTSAAVSALNLPPLPPVGGEVTGRNVIDV